MISELNIIPSQSNKPNSIRSLLLFAFFTLFTTLHAQKTERVTLDGLIQAAISQNPGSINDSTRKDLVLKITRTWYNWLYTLNTTGILNEYHDLLSDLERVARLRYESGDIDYIQFSTSCSILAQIVTNTAIFENKSQQHKNTLCALTLKESQLIPADTMVDLYEINKFSSSGFDAKSDTLSGYSEFAKNLELENLYLELDNLFIRLGYYRKYGLTFAEGIRETAIARLRSEDIEYLEYAGYMEKSLKIQLEYFEVLNQYNQCAIHIEEYAY